MHNDMEKTPLDCAAWKVLRVGVYDIRVARFLIDNGAAVSAQDNKGNPFLSASYFGYLHVTKLLLECDIVDIRNGSEQSLLYCRQTRRHAFLNRAWCRYPL